MGALVFTLAHEPRTWKRTANVNGRRRVTPAGQEEHQQALGWAATARRPRRWPLDARYAVLIDVYLSRRTTSDLDNYAKNVLDALEGVAWSNDRQVDDLHVRRHLDSANPRTVVHIATREAL